MKLTPVNSAREAGELVRELKFLPMFRSSIEGFSLEEATPRERWFVNGVDGPWEWREALAASDEFAYGKLFERKAGFIHRSILKKFINYRRDGYDFDARYEDSLAPERAKRIVDLLSAGGSMHAPDIKRRAGFLDGTVKGFDGMLSLLQMQTYLTVFSFDYKTDRFGNAYGFGVGRYGLMEDKFGADFVSGAYEESPEDSLAYLLKWLIGLFPGISEDAARKLLR